MSVDVTNFVQDLQTEVNAPGTNSFPNATTTDWIYNLLGGFWEAKLDGFMANWTMDDNGLITPIATGGTDITRDFIQLIILYASFRIIRNQLINLRTQFRASAGPVTFEYQQSANLLTQVLKDLTTRRDILLTRLSDLGLLPTYYIDAVIARDDQLRQSNIWWVGTGEGIPGSDLGIPT